MTIVLTKDVNGKKAEFDLISLNGKATVRKSSLKELKKVGVKEKEIEKMGFDIESAN